MSTNEEMVNEEQKKLLIDSSSPLQQPVTHAGWESAANEGPLQSTTIACSRLHHQSREEKHTV
jgi:hypothetical protein